MAALLLALGWFLSASMFAAPSPLPSRSVVPSVRPGARSSGSPVPASASPAPETDDEEILKNLDFFAYMDAAEHQDMPGAADEEEEEPED